MRTHRLTLTGLTTLCLLAGCLVLSGPPAFAVLRHPFIGSFGATGAGSLFVVPNDVTVDQSTGDVYVVDVEAKVVYKFDASGEPTNFSALGSNVLNGSATPQGSFSFDRPSAAQVAVDESGPSSPTDGDIYVTDSNDRVVDVFGPGGEYLGSQLSVSGEPCGVAVDPAGNVYIGNYNGSEIDKFTPHANPVVNGDFVSKLSGVPNPCYVAVDSAGNIYANQYQGPLTQDPLASFPVSGSASALNTPFDPNSVFVFGVGVDPVTNDVYVDEGSAVVQYSSAGVLRPAGLTTLGSSHGVAVGHSAGVIYVSDDEKGTVDIFGPPVVLPDVSTGSASSVSTTGATIAGTVNPDETPTTYQFEYGTGTSYGQLSPASPEVVGSDNTVHNLSATLTGLLPGQLYHYRLNASNSNGTNSGQDQTFRTPGASVVDGEFSPFIAITTVVLEAQVNPNSQDTTCRFEYVSDAAYNVAAPDPYSAGASLPCPADLGSGFGDQSASVKVTGLTAGTLYHFQVVAVNASGSTQGATEVGDQTFTTLAPPPVVSTGAASDISPTGARVTGTVNPEGLPTTYRYQYGTDTSYGESSVSIEAGSGSSEVAAPSTLSTLQPDTVYHYRLVATNDDGTSYGQDQTLTTAAAVLQPIVATGGASEISQNAATISGTVNTQGLQTVYGFEIGTDTEYGPPTGLGSIGAGLEEAGGSLSLTGLLPGTTYHYRITATNVDGTAYGADETFTTTVYPNHFVEPPAPLAFVAVPAVAFPAEVTPVAKTKAKHKKGKAKRKAKRKAKARRHRRGH